MVIAMKLSVRIVTGFQSTQPWLVLGERAVDLREGISPGCLAPAFRILAKSVRGFGPERERFVDFGTDMLEEFGHDGETADDDAD